MLVLLMSDGYNVTYAVLVFKLVKVTNPNSE
jgi:hypothetical protein